MFKDPCSLLSPCAQQGTGLRTVVGPLDPHAVILHCDESYRNHLDVVVAALVYVVGVLSIEKAWSIAVKAFTIGKDVVIVCPKETAEHYQVCLALHGLTITVEAQ